MKAEYDVEAGSMYVYMDVEDTKVHVTRELEYEPNVVLDLNKYGQVIGIEFVSVTLETVP
jgi:uncharacterized protein YuzE